MTMMRWPLVAAITVGLTGAAAMSAAQTAVPIYKDPRQPVEARVNDLMSRLTLDEKVAQLETVWESKAKLQAANGHFSPELAAKNFPNGIGGFARPSDYRGVTLVLAPVVDVAKDPRWGRIEETFGEDPYLVTQMGLAAIRGFQGRTLPLPADKVFVTLKHFTGHGAPESGTNVGPAHLGER